MPFFGGNSEEVTPVPISNTEVKLFSADGTAREAVWESRTPPEFYHINPESESDSGFFIRVFPPGGGSGFGCQEKNGKRKMA